MLKEFWNLYPFGAPDHIGVAENGNGESYAGTMPKEVATELANGLSYGHHN
jgi:hypothetical protein